MQGGMAGALKAYTRAAVVEDIQAHFGQFLGFL
jgi:hypothetical protein